MAIFLQLKSFFSKLSYKQKTVIYLCFEILIFCGVWGSYPGNFSRLVKYIEKPTTSVNQVELTKSSTFITPSKILINTAKKNATPKTTTKKNKIPKTIAPVLPTQSNGLFSTYPVWSQNFENYESNKLNSSYWNIFQGPPPNINNESEYYTDNSTNLRITNNNLTLEATKSNEPDGYHYASARIDTQNKKSFLYGRIDVIAKVPDGVGTWPAVWLLPSTSKYNNNPSTSSSGGEIDLIEEVGFNQNLEYGIVHTESDISNAGVGKFNTIDIPNNDTTYNLYSVLWTPSSITFEINDAPFFTYNKPSGANYTTWPFNEPYYLILNLALGGTWGGQDMSNFPSGIDNSDLPAAMHVQSIYYYSYVGPK